MTFQGTAGQRVQMQTLSQTGGTVYFAVKRPGGANLWNHDGNRLLDSTVLPDTGTYKVWFDPASTVVGSLDFKLWSVPADVDAGEVLIDGVAKRFANTSAGQNGWMTFQGTAGQRVQMQTLNQTGGTMYFAVKRPGGANLWNHDGNRLLDTHGAAGHRDLQGVVRPGVHGGRQPGLQAVVGAGRTSTRVRSSSTGRRSGSRTPRRVRTGS